MRAWLCILAPIVSWSTAGSAAQLVAPVPPGFVTANSAHNDRASIEERVPSGETVDQWSRMITIQWFRNLAPQRDRFVAAFTGSMTTACPGATHDENALAGTAIARFDCPLNPQTGKPEVFFARLFVDGADVRMAQVAFRSNPTADQVRWARDYLTRISLAPE